jgi:hypothetical protein
MNCRVDFSDFDTWIGSGEIANYYLCKKKLYMVFHKNTENKKKPIKLAKQIEAAWKDCCKLPQLHKLPPLKIGESYEGNVFIEAYYPYHIKGEFESFPKKDLYGNITKSRENHSFWPLFKCSPDAQTFAHKNGIVIPVLFMPKLYRDLPDEIKKREIIPFCDMETRSSFFSILETGSRLYV